MINENLGKKNAPEECVSDRAGIPEGDIGESAVRVSANAMRERAKTIYNKAKVYDALYDTIKSYMRDNGNVKVHLSVILFMMKSGLDLCSYTK